jgi:hypothetical protein
MTTVGASLECPLLPADERRPSDAFSTSRTVRLGQRGSRAFRALYQHIDTRALA